MIIGAALFFPLLWAWHDGSNDLMPILYSIIISLGCGLLLILIFKKGDLGYRGSFALVTLAWLTAILFGSLPYILSGLFSLPDAIFESTSGFSTTGASILSNIEALPRGLLFWRQMTHWLGGMGIMVLFVATMTQSGFGAVQIFKAEYTVAFKDHMLPRIRSTAGMLAVVYASLSLLIFVVYLVLGMSFFDAICHSFSTVATGGFSTRNASIAAFNSPAIEWATSFFMFAAGINFFLYYNAYKKHSFRPLWNNIEFRFYMFIMLALIVTISALLLPAASTDWLTSLRHAVFQSVSLMTGTGYATADYDIWPAACKILLLAAMLLGGCAGSTTCSIKIIRWILMIKQSVLELKKLVHPRAVFSLKIQNTPVANEVIIRAFHYFFIFVLIFIIGAVALTAMGLDFLTACSASLAALANVGPGLGAVGPAMNYGLLPVSGKYLLSVLMLLGRLEIFTVLVIFLPSFWESGNFSKSSRSFKK